MPNPDKMAPIELILPADPNLMLVIRLTAAGVIARAGVTVDRMDDLKMAVEEACGCLIDQEHAPERLHLRFSCAGDGLEIYVAGLTDGERAGRMSEAELDVVRCILHSLVEQAEFDMQNGWIASISMRAALAR